MRRVVLLLLLLASSVGARPVTSGQRATVERRSGPRVFAIMSEAASSGIIPYEKTEIRVGQGFVLIGDEGSTFGRVTQVVRRGDPCPAEVGVIDVPGRFDLAVGPVDGPADWSQKAIPEELIAAAFPDRDGKGLGIVRASDDQPRHGVVAFMGGCEELHPAAFCIREVAIDPGGALRVLAEKEVVCDVR
jgi:hypothetical protein